MIRPATIGLVISLIMGTQAGAQIVRSGFNDVTGINGDSVSNNSPFNIANAPLGGQGAGEAGWANTWQNPFSVARVQGVSFEGDGAAFLQGTSGAIRDLQQPMSGITSVQLRMMISSGTVGGNGINLYITQSDNQNTFLRIGPQWQATPDGHFKVVDGVEDGAVTGLAAVEDTGLLWTPGTWHQVRIDIDTTARTWEFYADGQHYNAPDPLGYRGNPTRLDEVYFLTEISAPNGAYLDAVVVQPVPEPGLPFAASVTIGAFALSVRRIKRRLFTAEGLVDLAELLTLLRLRAERAAE